MKPVVTSNWLYEHLSNSNLIILDTSIKSATNSSKPKFTGICIKGARFFDLKNNFSNKNHHISNMIPSPEHFTKECQSLGINKNSTIVVYDNLGIYSSPRVWWMFKVMGFNNIAVLDGGLPEWIKQNLPTEKMKHSIENHGNFIATYKHDLVKDQKQVLENIHSRKEILIDARSDGRFTGKSAEPREGLKSGHIPNSMNIPYKSVLKNVNSTSKCNFLAFERKI